MLPTVLRRWSLCYSYFVRLWGFYCETFRVESHLAPCTLLYLFFLSIKVSNVITWLAEERSWLHVYVSLISVCLSCMPYFVSVFLFSLVPWIGCGL